MSLFGDLFKGGESKVKAESLLTPEQRTLLNTMIGDVQRRMQRPAPTSPDMYSPANETEKQLFGWARSKAIQDMLQGKVPYEVGPQYAEQYFEEAIKPGMVREWQERVLPQIRESYAGPGYWHTDRMHQETKSAEQLAENLGAKRSELIYNEELNRRQAIENAMSRIPQAYQTVSHAAAMERDVEHERLTSNLTKFLMGEEVDGMYNPAYNPAMQEALNLLGVQAIGFYGSSKGPSLGYGMLQGAGEGIGQILPSLLKNWLSP